MVGDRPPVTANLVLPILIKPALRKVRLKHNYKLTNFLSINVVSNNINMIIMFNLCHYPG